MNNQIIFWTGLWPHWCSRPIGVYQLAHWLRLHKIESQIIDFCQWFKPEELVELTDHFIGPKTKYIGISSSFWEGKIPFEINEAVNIIRKQYPHLKIILGGARADSDQFKSIADHIIVGEAEEKILEIIKGHNIGISKFDIRNLEHRFIEKDAILEGEVLPIELGRGCIFKCKFCGHPNLGKPKHTYQRKINLIEEEISYNYEKFKTDKYFFLDDTVNEDQEKILNLSNIPKNTGINIQWTGYLRADLVWRYPDSAELLAKSGLRSCFFGIESFHKTASLSIGKGWAGKHAKNFLPILFKDIWQSKISIWNNFIIGLPEESLDDLNQTLEWCIENPLGTNHFVPLNLFNARSDSGSKSEFTRNFEKYGYQINEDGWYNKFLNRKKADLYSKVFNNRLIKYNKLSAWSLFDVANCGIDIDQGMQIGHFKKQNIIQENFPIFLERYRNKLKSL